ncbi:hypothetical protein [Campylobacter curvus]|uniref:hypothetical protein n=1 Tax=Campylobacter curvus TaxID=200 RepID=UPI0014705245|nr:hypothetical protein [Campylobacter curvus]
MAKSLIRNKFGTISKGFALPADGATAKAFCDNHLEGEYEVYEVESTSGNETEAAVTKVTVTGQNAAGRKVTFGFYAQANIKESEIRTALLNGTFNSVKFETVHIIEMKAIALS